MLKLYDLSGKNDLRFSPPCWNIKLCLIQNEIKIKSVTRNTAYCCNGRFIAVHRCRSRAALCLPNVVQVVQTFLSRHKSRHNVYSGGRTQTKTASFNVERT